MAAPQPELCWMKGGARSRLEFSMRRRGASRRVQELIRAGEQGKMSWLTMKSDELRDWPWLREVVVDRNDPAPPVQQLAHSIRNKIATGHIRAGNDLPSVRQLAAFTGTTAATVSRTYQLLQAEGLLVTMTGAGTRVAEVENLEQSARTGMLQAASAVLDKTMSSLASLGLAAEDVDRLLRERSGLHPAMHLSLVFVSRQHTNMMLYEEQLSRAMQGLAVEVHCLPLEQLEEMDPGAQRLLDEADVIASLVTYRRRLAELTARAPEVRYIIAEVSMEAVEGFMDLPSTENVALIAGGNFKTVGLGILHTYFSPERITVVRDIHDESALRAIPPDTVIVHTYSQMRHVQETLPDHRRICMDFDLRSDSLGRLRRFVADELSRASASNYGALAGAD